jgi:hypothetical protein
MAGERLVLTTPATVTGWAPCGFDLRIGHPQSPDGVRLHFVNDLGEVRVFWVEDRALAVSLNRANMSTISLQRRLVQYAIANDLLGPGAAAGTVLA